MYCVRKNTGRKSKKKIREGTLVRVHSSQDIRVRMQDPVFGDLQDLEFYGNPIVGVVTKLWPGGYGSARELEMYTGGEFLILTTGNGFEIDEIEVLE